MEPQCLGVAFLRSVPDLLAPLPEHPVSSSPAGGTFPEGRERNEGPTSHMDSDAWSREYASGWENRPLGTVQCGWLSRLRSTGDFLGDDS